MKRAVYFIASLLLVMLMASCGKAASTSSGQSKALGDSNIVLDGTLPIIKDPEKQPKMKVLYVTPVLQKQKAKDLRQTKKWEKETGVIFDWNEIPFEGSTEKINLMLASRDLPDVFWNNITNEQITQFIGQNVFIPTEELTTKYMKKMNAIFEKRPFYKAMATATDGHRYGFPYIEEMFGLVLTPGPFYINKTWLDKVGKKIPTTVDEYVDCLRAFRDAKDLNGNNKKDETPYALEFVPKMGRFGSYNTFHQFTACFGKYTTYNFQSDDFMSIENNKVVFNAIDPAYKDTAKFFNQLNKEKLIDPDSFTPGTGSSPLFTNKLKADVALIGSFSVWNFTAEVPNISVRKEYVALPRLQGKKGKMGHRLNFSEMQFAGQSLITTACKYPEVVAAFIDYIQEPEIAVTSNWGALDFVYKKGSDGVLHFDLDKDNNIVLKDGYKTFTEMRQNSTPQRGSYIVLNDYYGKIVDYTWDAQTIIRDQRINGKDDILKEYTAVPRMFMSAEDGRKIAQIQPQIADIVNRYTMKWVLDGNIDATWNTYLADLKAAGLESLMGIFQTGYDRYLANLK